MLGDITGEYSIETIVMDIARLDDDPISSTVIRSALAAGDVGRAQQLLGRPYSIKGTVAQKRGEGSRFGFPTANMTDPTPYGLIADGVYAGTVTLEDGSSNKAAIFIGVPSNAADDIRVLEAHLLDFKGDLVGREVVVSLDRRIRDIVDCKSDEELLEVISRNVKDASH
jgi:riboflavin kinase/FMN adenylyltransferase